MADFSNRNISKSLLSLFVLFALLVPSQQEETTALSNNASTSSPQNSSVLNCQHHVTFKTDMKTLSIWCMFSAGTPTEVAWYYNGEAHILPSAHYQYNIDNGNISLKMEPNRADPAGMYLLKVNFTQDGKQLQVNGSIFVERRPHIINPFTKSTYAKLGDSLNLTCEEAGDNFTEISWLIRDQHGKDVPFFGNGNTTIVKGDKHWSEIIFTKLEYSDRNYYTCQAKNLAGRDYTVTFLRVQSPIRWVYPFVALLGCILLLVLIMTFNTMYQKLRPSVHVSSSETTFSRKKVQSLGPIEELAPASDSLPRLLEAAKRHGYPTSVIYAIIKWRAFVEMRRNSGFQGFIARMARKKTSQ